MEPVSAQQLELWAREAQERWSVPGISVGLVRAGDAVYAAAGVRELTRPEPVTPGTVFRVASITKPFVASLALSLVQDRLLALDEPPPGSRVKATVRALLGHQGGLAQEWPTPVEAFGDDDEALLSLGAADPERLPDGSAGLFSYCNAGYWLVGAAAARVTGTSFEQALATRILDPLELAETGFEADAPARGHVQVEPGADEHRPVEDRYPRVRRPSGGLWSSVSDLLRFAQHHLGGPGPLTADSIAEMQRPQVSGPGFDSGLGWFLTQNRGRATIDHPGSAAGYQSLLLLVPHERLAFVGLTNSSRGSAAIRDVIERIGLGPQEAPDAPLSSAELERFAGRYVGQGAELAFAPADGGLRVELRDYDPFSREWQTLPPVWARPVGPREFEIVDGEWRGERFDFPRDGFVCMTTLAQRVE